ncbi:GTP-dependent dephospho-CoA kinase family protein [Haloferacaceae archaeon DSL9]
MLSLPESLRGAFKEPLGPVYTDVDALLAEVDRTDRELAPGIDAPLVAVGDVVTYHLRVGGRRPDVAVIDGKTERESVTAEIREVVDDPGDDETQLTVENPPASLSMALCEAIRDALARSDRTTIVVEGEEDLATLPALVAAPVGASVIYGQPGEGMVQVAVTEAARERAATLLSRMDGDTDSVLDALRR